MTDGYDISSEIALRWTSLDLSDDKSTLVQVMDGCRKSTSYYLNQFWPKFCRHMASIGHNELSHTWAFHPAVRFQQFYSNANLWILFEIHWFIHQLIRCVLVTAIGVNIGSDNGLVPPGSWLVISEALWLSPEISQRVCRPLFRLMSIKNVLM